MEDILDQLSGQSIAVQRLREQVQRQSKFYFPLLLEGERGSGKRFAAKVLYRLSPFAEKKLYSIDAADSQARLPEVQEIRENGGFVLIEEIGNASSEMQKRFWSWLRSLGEDSPKFRIVATSSEPLGALVALRRFRSDLYLRLRASTIELPPLRSRGEDIPFLVRDFLEEAAQLHNEPDKMFTAEAMDWMIEFSWPGNISQLRNEILYASAATPGKIIPESAFRPDLVYDPDLQNTLLVKESRTLAFRMKEYERKEILHTLKEVGGYRDRAAQALGIDRRTLQRKLREWKSCGLLVEETN